MRELSIEEKAKAYEDTLDRAKKELDACGSLDCDAARQIFRLFPELMESGDEKIRKELLAVINDLVLPDEQQSRFITWLEAQGEHTNFRNAIQVGDKVTRNEDGVLVNLSQLNRVAKKDEKQGEQKPTEWSSEQRKTLQTDVVLYESSTDSHLWTRAICFDGEPMESKPCEQTPAAWSEEDVNKPNGGIVMEDFNDDNGFYKVNLAYLNKEQVEEIEELVKRWDLQPKGDEDESIISDLLDYFDEDKCLKHEVNDVVRWLKTIKPQQKGWDEKEIKMLDNLITYLNGRKDLLEEIKCTYISCLKSLKERVQPQPQKEWSEEDESMLQNILECLKNGWMKLQTDILKYESWLKSLRPHLQWKPSEGQLECLGYAIDKAEKDWSPLTNNRIYLTLKALKEQLLELNGSKV